MKTLLAPVVFATTLAVAPVAGAVPIGVLETFENDSAGFSAAFPGATLVTVDFDALTPGAVAAGTVAQGNVAGFSVTLAGPEQAVTANGSTALEIGALFGAAGVVTFSAPVIGVGATFNDVTGGAFGGAFVNFGFDADGDGAVGATTPTGDVTMTAIHAQPTFLGLRASAAFQAIGISTFPSFGVAGSIDDLVFAVAARPPVGVVPLPASLPLLLAGLAGLAALRRPWRAQPA